MNTLNGKINAIIFLKRGKIVYHTSSLFYITLRYLLNHTQKQHSLFMVCHRIFFFSMLRKKFSYLTNKPTFVTKIRAITFNQAEAESSSRTKRLKGTISFFLKMC